MMNPRDKSNLSFQFKIKIFLKNGIEFQSFFEDIMEKSFIDFQKIKPYGNRGDAGNDGYRKNSGIYYQVYAPNTPKVNEQNAVKKMQEDFQKLKDGWNEISNIKEYYFVFNDKYDGSIQSLENGISTLKANNPDIDFKLFLAKDLEGEFFRLSDADILSLGFNIDQRQALSHAYDFLNYIKIELDRENAIFAQKLIDNIRDIISALAEDNLSLEFELLECPYCGSVGFYSEYSDQKFIPA